MKVAITGVTGLIGSALRQSLVADGHEVLGVSRQPGPDTVTWNVDTQTMDAGALEGVDAVVHLAGETIDGRWTAAKKQRLVSSRVEGTQLLVDTIAQLDHKPQVMVSGSAMGVYGDRGDELLTDSAAPGQSFLAGLVVAWEAAAAPVTDLGVRVAYARTSLVLARHDGALKRMALITKLGAGGRLGSGRQYWSWITLDDQVRALRHLIDTEIEGPVNVATEHPVTQLEFAKTLGRVLRRPAILPAPAFAIRWVLGQMGQELLLSSARLAPEALHQSGFAPQHPELDGALRSLL